MSIPLSLAGRILRDEAEEILGLRLEVYPPLAVFEA
jgi:hypothetical protein